MYDVEALKSSKRSTTIFHFQETVTSISSQFYIHIYIFMIITSVAKTSGQGFIA
jgi:hypothetical protein